MNLNEELKFLIEKAYKPKIQNEINKPKINNDLNLWHIYFFLSFLWDMYIIFYFNSESKYKEPIKNLKNSITEKYEKVNKEKLINETNLFNEKWIKKFIDEENIKTSITKLEKLREELNKTLIRYEKNKFLHLESLKIKYKKYKDFIKEENKYQLGVTLNGYCSLIEDILIKILETEMMKKKLKKDIINCVKDTFLFFLAIISLVLGIMALA